MHQLSDFSDELYLAGQTVPSGMYREIDTGREVRVGEHDQLPASLDGRVAAYICVEYTWGQRQVEDSPSRLNTPDSLAPLL